MKLNASLETFLATIRLWLTSAHDAEVDALAALVAAEQARRALAQPEAPAACGQGEKAGQARPL